MHHDGAGVAGDDGRDRVEPVAQPFGFPPADLAGGAGEQSAPGDQVGGERDDGAPDPVLVTACLLYTSLG